MNTIIQQIQSDLREQSDPVKADFFPRYFKSEPGVTDRFLGVTVPKQRAISRQYYKILTPLDVVNLLQSEIHEERLTALFIWVLQFKKGDEKVKQQVFDLYLQNTNWINNWDLVDTSARDIVGGFIYDKDQTILDRLSVSKNVWERRIAIISTFYFIQKGEFAWTLKLAEQYLGDSHHYIHKATGWALREVGKKDRQVLISFLDQNASKMPRTALRYAIEHFPAQTRAVYLKAGKDNK